jgi:hypothetical protein
MHRDERSIDVQVLAALRSPTLSGMAALMNPKLISRHIGLITGNRLGTEPSAGRRRAQAARQGGARATRWQVANLLDGDSMTRSDTSRTEARPSWRAHTDAQRAPA